MKSYILLLRPHQYIKNLLIFAPIFFAQKLFNSYLVIQNAIAFVCFCAVASSVYVLNDYRDRESDRQHPVKKNRPLASGAVSPKVAFGIAIVLGISGLAIANWLSQTFFLILLSYLILNILYSLSLKHKALLDIYIIASGFLMRIFSGSEVTQVPASMWIVLITFCLALFLALAKRRADIILSQSGSAVRKSIDGYNLEFVNGAMVLLSSVVLICYIFYTISPEVTERFHTNHLYLTVLFVILGFLRYMQIIFVFQRHGDPTEIVLKDHFLQVTILAWLIAFLYFIY